MRPLVEFRSLAFAALGPVGWRDDRTRRTTFGRDVVSCLTLSQFDTGQTALILCGYRTVA